MVIRDLGKDDITDVARLHIEGIGTGFISSLGSDFVSCLYGAILQSKSSFGFVAVEDGVVVGFAAVSTNIKELYKTVILSNGLRLALKAAGKMLSLRRIRNVLETLFYPSRIEAPDLPHSELLAMAVEQRHRRRGIGDELVHRVYGECSRRSIDRLKVVTGALMEGTNKFYAKCGFESAGQFENHGVASNIYVAQVNSALSRWRVAASEAAATARGKELEIVEIRREDRERERDKAPGKAYGANE